MIRPLFVALSAILFSAVQADQFVLETDATWRTAPAAVAGWEDESFDDSAWALASVNLISALGPANVQYIWDNPDKNSGAASLAFRKKFTINGTVDAATIDVGVDDDVQLYVNGILAVSDTNGTATGIYGTNVAHLLTKGDNVITAVANNVSGPRHFGIRLTVSFTPEPTLPTPTIAQAVAISFASEVGVTYTIQESSDAVVWTDAVTGIVGDGQVKKHYFDAVGAKKFYRLAVP